MRRLTGNKEKRKIKKKTENWFSALITTAD